MSTFDYDPKEAESAGLIPTGDYDVEIVTVEPQISKAGSNMLKITLKVWNNGTTSTVFDYIVKPSTLWKLKKICEATGLDAEFATGKLDPELLVGKGFRATIDQRVDSTGKYPAQNVIKKYSKHANASDDMPF